MTAAVARVEKIRFFKSAVKSKSKFHLSVGHSTVMCTVTFFGSDEGGAGLEIDRDYHYLDELALPPAGSSTAAPGGSDAGKSGDATGAASPSGGGSDGAGGNTTPSYRHQFAVLEFDAPVNCSPDALIIGSRLDADVGDDDNSLFCTRMVLRRQ
jgi:selenocysteine-specific elongation factor